MDAGVYDGCHAVAASGVLGGDRDARRDAASLSGGVLAPPHGTSELGYVALLDRQPVVEEPPLGRRRGSVLGVQDLRELTLGVGQALGDLLLLGSDPLALPLERAGARKERDVRPKAVHEGPITVGDPAVSPGERQRLTVQLHGVRTERLERKHLGGASRTDQLPVRDGVVRPVFLELGQVEDD